MTTVSFLNWRKSMQVPISWNGISEHRDIVKERHQSGPCQGCYAGLSMITDSISSAGLMRFTSRRSFLQLLSCIRMAAVLASPTWLIAPVHQGLLLGLLNKTLNHLMSRINIARLMCRPLHHGWFHRRRRHAGQLERVLPYAQPRAARLGSHGSAALHLGAIHRFLGCCLQQARCRHRCIISMKQILFLVLLGRASSRAEQGSLRAV